MPSRISPLQISAYTATSAVGVGKEVLADALAQSRSGLRANDFGDAPLPTWIGRVDGLEEVRLPESLAHWDCRNNRLAWLGLQADGFLEAVAAAREKYGASRVALILGTSTASIGETELAYTQLDEQGMFPPNQRRARVHTPHSLAMFTQQLLGISGPSETISTACSSSAKVFASAERLIRLGLADAAVVGGADTLCGSVLFGFNSLELVSSEPCRPFDASRKGISLGEAAGFALLERGRGPLELLGYGEASDAHHMSTPHPEGLGAEKALDDALARAGVAVESIDYINMHGTASIGETELAYTLLDEQGMFPPEQRRAAVHTPHSLAMFAQQLLGITGPSETISTACSSSAKVFASAERLIRLGLADAAVVGGADTLCGSVLFGFNSLELVSSEPCRPFDASRKGISLGEAAGFALVERVQTGADAAPLHLLGYGEASDAHHMSTPHPEGLGAERALDEALARAGLAPEAIDYINMHGTASQKNDEVEGALVARRFPARTHASSTKGFMGHTLGAAGIVEAVISLLAIERGLMPGTVNTRTLDEGFGPQIKLEPAHGEVRYALSNSFGFGGNNCSLVFGKAAAA